MIRPAREALRLPSARKVVMEEKRSAAAAPRCPRSQARSGTRRSNKSSQGCMKDNPHGELGDQKSGRLKRTSFHKLVCFIEEQPAVFAGRVVARELDQVAAIKEIAQERLLIAREGRGCGERIQKFDRSLARDRQLVLLGDIAP